MKKIKELFKKYKEVILYVVFGVLTTVVNFAAFWLFNKLIGENVYLLNNAIAWFVAVLFAFVTNKIWVFDSKSWAFKVLSKELPEFFAARLFSLGVEEAGLWLLVEKLNFGEKVFSILGLEFTGKFIAKVILAVVVVILNYFFSKFVIFAKKKKDE